MTSLPAAPPRGQRRGTFPPALKPTICDRCGTAGMAAPKYGIGPCGGAVQYADGTIIPCADTIPQRRWTDQPPPTPAPTGSSSSGGGPDIDQAVANLQSAGLLQPPPGPGSAAAVEAASPQCAPSRGFGPDTRPTAAPNPDPDLMRAAAVDYHRLGWHPLHVKAGAKWPPADGRTGYDPDHPRRNPARPPAADMTIDEILTAPWDGNLAVRMPLRVIAIDIDNYKADEGGGLAAFRALVGDTAPLQAAPASTRRYLPSGHYYFQLPPEWDIDGWPPPLRGQPCPGVEILQRHHRYSLVWPSVVDGLGYRHHPPAGQPGGPDDGGIPAVTGLPLLPAEWLNPLQTGQPTGGWAGMRSGPGGGRRRRGRPLNPGGGLSGRHGQIFHDAGELTRRGVTDTAEAVRLLAATAAYQSKAEEQGEWATRREAASAFEWHQQQQQQQPPPPSHPGGGGGRRRRGRPL